MTVHSLTPAIGVATPQQAQVFLGVSDETADDFVMTMFTTKVRIRAKYVHVTTTNPLYLRSMIIHLAGTSRGVLLNSSPSRGTPKS